MTNGLMRTTLLVLVMLLVGAATSWSADDPPIPTALALAPDLPAERDACAGCHNNASPRTNGAVRMDEFTTFDNFDRHLRPFDVERGRRIAERLKGKPLEQREDCRACHVWDWTQASPANHDGANRCEICHTGDGGSRRWITEHTRIGRTHHANALVGMRSLEVPRERAGLCLRCHIGAPSHDRAIPLARDSYAVTHELLAAGHPRLVFDLEAFSRRQPGHFVRRESAKVATPGDDPCNKTTYTPVVFWAVGLGELARHELTLFAGSHETPKRWPELAVFDCQTCHHPVDSNAPRRARPDLLGRPRFNDGGLRVYVGILRLLPGSAADADRIGRRLDELQDRIGRNDPRATDTATGLATDLADTLPTIQCMNVDAGLLRAILRMLARSVPDDGGWRYTTAEPIFYGLQAILETTAHQSGVEPAAGRRLMSVREIQQLRDAFRGLAKVTRTHRGFPADRFSAGLRDVRAVVDAR